MVTVKDLADGTVRTPEIFRIARTHVVWQRAAWPVRKRWDAKVRLTPAPHMALRAWNDKVGRMVWTVEPNEAVLAYDPLRGGWYAYEPDANVVKDDPLAGLAEADAEAHKRHLRCGHIDLVAEGDVAHIQRHAARNPNCPLCKNALKDIAAKAAQARAEAEARRESERKVEEQQEAKILAGLAALALEGPDVAEATACGHDGTQLAFVQHKWYNLHNLPKATFRGSTFKVLGHGASRVAVDLGCGKHIAKVNYRGNDAHLGNQTEKECKRFMKFTEAQRRDFCRVFLWSADYSLAVYEKADLEAPEDRFWERVQKIGVGDLHGRNLGYRSDGSKIVLDYAL